MSKSYRILVCDDREEITNTFSELLSPEKDIGINELKGLASSLFEANDSDSQEHPRINLRVDTANQGLEAIDMAADAQNASDPYKVAVLDMRMPPGINGFETAIKLIEIDPQIELCFCTAYSDITISVLADTLGQGRFLLLKKPVNPDELITTVEFLSKNSVKCTEKA